MAPSAQTTLLFINGKFLTQQMTGVQRYAACLLRALDDVLAAAPPAGLRVQLLCPAGAVVPPLQRIEVRRAGVAALGGTAWEQACLPWLARRGWLINLAGSAPAWGLRRQLCTLHDAAVFDQPGAYTRAFVAWYRWLFARVARRAARVITVSSFSRQRLEQWLPALAGRVSVVCNGADHLDTLTPDTAVLARLGLHPGRYFMAVASRSPSKNLARLQAAFTAFTAFTALGAPGDVRLVLVGGSNPQVFAASPQGPVQGGADAAVVRTGRLSDAEVKALYQHALALVLPSLYEGFGLPAVEAMACGCPVAAADIPALREVCADAAVFFDPGSVPRISACLQRLLHDSALRDELRQAGPRRATGYRWRCSAQRLHALLQCLPHVPGTAFVAP